MDVEHASKSKSEHVEEQDRPPEKKSPVDGNQLSPVNHTNIEAGCILTTLNESTSRYKPQIALFPRNYPCAPEISDVPLKSEDQQAAEKPLINFPLKNINYGHTKNEKFQEIEYSLKPPSSNDSDQHLFGTNLQEWNSQIMFSAKDELTFNERKHISMLYKFIGKRNVEKLHKCDICSTAFSYESTLNIHMRSHTGERPYKCGVCGKAFTQKGILNNHLNTHVDRKPYNCYLCEKGFSQKSQMDKHLLNHIKDNFCKYNNKKCNKRASSKQQLEEKPFKCHICGKIFCHKSTLDIHFRSHTKEKPYRCGICRKAFTQKGTLGNHLNIHAEKKPHICDLCDKGFAQKSLLDRHLISHTDGNVYKYDLCRESSTVTDKKRLHNDASKHSDKKPFTPDAKKPKLLHKTILKVKTRHQRDMFNKGFIQKDRSHQHVWMQVGKMPYKCDVCDAKFPHESTLIVHFRSHTKYKPYECYVCGKALTQKGNFNQHFNTHLSEKLFNCYICHKGFSQKKQLTKHQNIHLNENTDKCGA